MNRQLARWGTTIIVGAGCLVAWMTLPVAAQSRGEQEPPRRASAGGATHGQQAPTTREAEPQPANPVPPRQPPAPPQRFTLPPESENVPPVRFEATVFQIEVEKDRIVDLDAKKLAAAGPTPATLLKTLRDFGPTTVLYRVDECVSASEGRRYHDISIARDTPYVTGTQTSPTGETTPSYARAKVGGNFKVSSFFPDDSNRQKVLVGLEIEVSRLTDSSVQTGGDITAPVFWSIEQTYGGITELGKPVVLLSVDGSSTAGADMALAFVTLVRWSEP